MVDKDTTKDLSTLKYFSDNEKEFFQRNPLQYL